MVMEPAVQSFDSRRQTSQMNGVAIFILLLLAVLSAGIAVAMAFNEIGRVWMLGEILVLNMIGVCVLLAFKVAEQ